MHLDEQDRCFRRGLSLARTGMLSEAAVLFHRLVAEGSEEPLHLSYCGLLTATIRGDREEGLRLCERALQYGADEADVVLNLARLYESVGQRERAVKLLRRGLRRHKGHPALTKLIDKLSPRRTPPLTMVDRNHYLNKHLAILLAKLNGRYRGGESGERAESRARRSKLVTP